MTNPEIMMAGAKYESFIRRAHRCDYSKPGVKCTYFENLLNMDLGKNLSFLGPYPKYLKQIKNYLLKAIDAFNKMKIIKPEDLNVLNGLKEHIVYASSGMDLIDMIKEGENVTRKYKEILS